MGASGNAPVRQVYLDWLRVLAILTIFLFHSTRFFDLGDWHVKNAHTYFAVQLWTDFLASWGMPFIFVISGASSFFALGKRSAAEFAKERVLRLAIPLVVGIFTHCAVQVYLDRITHGVFRGSLWSFLPHYFDGLWGYGGNFAWQGMHLWYLEVLFVFSVLLLPLMIWSKRSIGAQWLARTTALLSVPGLAYALALPVMVCVATVDPSSFLGSRTWAGWSLAAHALFFLGGFVLVSDDNLQERIQQGRWVSMLLGAMTASALIMMIRRHSGFDFGTARDPLFFAVVGLNAWCWILTIWGFGRKHLNAATPLLLYANEAVLPFYILHQTVLLVVGYFVVQWEIPDPLKWAIISSASLAIILLVYDRLIRRSNVLRILFGMRPLARKPPLTAPRATAA